MDLILILLDLCERWLLFYWFNWLFIIVTRLTTIVKLIAYNSSGRCLVFGFLLLGKKNKEKRKRRIVILSTEWWLWFDGKQKIDVLTETTKWTTVAAVGLWEKTLCQTASPRTTLALFRGEWVQIPIGKLDDKLVKKVIPIGNFQISYKLTNQSSCSQCGWLDVKNRLVKELSWLDDKNRIFQ